MQLLKLIKDKSIIFGLVVVLFVILLAIFSAGNIGLNNQAFVSPSPTSQLSTKTISTSATNSGDTYLERIATKFPLSQEEFETSAKIKTSIKLYLPTGSSPNHVILEVGGLSYTNPDASFFRNQEALAYADSFQQAMSMLRAKNIDPKLLTFRYGNDDRIIGITNKWLSTLRLAP